MSSVLLAVVIVVVVFLFLALFGRGGPTETIRSGDADNGAIKNLSIGELGSITARLFGELGFTVIRTEEKPDRVDLWVVDPTPLTGQSLYIRSLLVPAAGAVESGEVQSALDIARGENLAKAIVVTSGRFSDEARILSQSSSVELIDGPALSQLHRKHLPDAANRLGIPR